MSCLVDVDGVPCLGPSCGSWCRVLCCRRHLSWPVSPSSPSSRHCLLCSPQTLPAGRPPSPWTSCPSQCWMPCGASYDLISACLWSTVLRTFPVCKMSNLRRAFLHLSLEKERILFLLEGQNVWYNYNDLIFMFQGRNYYDVMMHYYVMTILNVWISGQCIDLCLCDYGSTLQILNCCHCIQ